MTYLEPNGGIYEYDMTEIVGQSGLPIIENKKMVTKHNWKMIGGLALMFLIGGLQALHGTGGWSSYVEMAISVLVVIEHGLNGNTE